MKSLLLLLLLCCCSLLATSNKTGSCEKLCDKATSYTIPEVTPTPVVQKNQETELLPMRQSPLNIL